MPSTTIHFPDELLVDIDRAAQDRGMSRNRFVNEACKAELDREAGEWPENFFSTGLNEDDGQVLRDAVFEMERVVYNNRRNRGAPLL